MLLRARYFCLLFGIVTSLVAQSQGSIFRISAAEHIRLQTSSPAQPDLTKCFGQARPYHQRETLDSLPTGHYLIVKPEGEKITWRTHQQSGIQWFLQQQEHRFAVRLSDAAGLPVRVNAIQLRTRNLRPSETDSTLFYGKSRHGGLLIAYLDQDTLVQELQGTIDKPLLLRRLQNFSQTRVGWVLSTPVRWVKRPVTYLHRGFSYGDWHVYRWPFQRLWNRITNWGNSRSARGYVAFSQPQYRPGDTLRLKALLHSKRDKPLRRPLRLRVRSTQRGPDFRYLDTILPSMPAGHYELTWILGDSLPLDRTYKIELREIKRYRQHTFSSRFQLADYELEEYQLKFLTTQVNFAANEAVAFDIQVADHNGLAIPTGDLRATLVTDHANALFTPSIHLPDTLWQWQEEVGDRTQLTLHLPDSLWPKARLEARLDLRFTGPNGQLLETSRQFSVKRPAWQPLLTVEGDSILAKVVGNAPSEALGTLSANGQVIGPLAVGERFPLRADVRYYNWRIADKQVQLSLRRLADPVDFDYRWLNDTLNLHRTNERERPIQRHLGQRGKKLEVATLTREQQLL
ncbi:MAG: hypothetical protein AAGJ82_10790 [Bacteroidota bacterium]